jgi:hypothetical protein
VLKERRFFNGKISNHNENRRQGRHIYYFCAEACKKAFEKNPEQYLECLPAKRKNWFTRWLDQLAESNRKEFGGKPKCH